jgi:hypothetical protein
LAEEHESGLVNAFIMSGRRERVATLMTPRRRADLRKALPHFKWFDEKLARGLKPEERTHASLAQLLRAHGAGETCYLVSVRKDLDGKFMDLEGAIDEVVAMGEPTIISFVPGKLAYYEDEWAKNSLLLCNKT